MPLLKQYESITRRIGPFVDVDGAAVTDLTIAQADIRLSKAGGDFAQTANAGGATHDENGWYSLTYDSADVDTLGTLDVAVNVAGALPVFASYLVVSAVAYERQVKGREIGRPASH